MKGGFEPRGIRGAGTGIWSNSSSDDTSETDPDTLCSTVELSESDDDSEAVEGSYSCFRGDEESLCRCLVGLKFGILRSFNSTELDDRWACGGGGTSFATCESSETGRFLVSLLGVFSSSCFSGSGQFSSASGSSIGIAGGLSLRSFGIMGRSIDGTDEGERWYDGLIGVIASFSCLRLFDSVGREDEDLGSGKGSSLDCIEDSASSGVVR